MKPRRDYVFSSPLAPAIEGLIQEKRSSGYVYNSNADVLKELDTFCIERRFLSDTVTKDLSDAWAVQRETEGISSRNIRVSNLRQVVKYLNSIGIESYVPQMLQSGETKIAHVFTVEERKEFFESLNKLDVKRNSKRLLEECRILFRLYKDRVVLITPDIAEMLRKYHEYIMSECPGEPLVFPGTKDGKPINEVTVRAYFQRTLAMTSYASISNPPTIKSFSHTFVVDRLNAWMENGENIEEKLPYLSKYLGHNSIHESLYYYHQVSEAFKIIHDRDKTSNIVIPEVKETEE